MSKRTRIASVTVALLLAVISSGSARAAAPRNDGLPEGSEPFDLDPASFTVEIDNPYWPMEPSTRWTYRETDAEGNVLKVIVTVTSETKKIANGVTARVVRDTVTDNGAVVEDTFDWYAQDTEGNIWYLGEDTAEFEKGKITSRDGSFEAGVDGALAGVAVPADPVDDLRYRQEYYAGEAEDQGEVLSVDEQVEVKAGHYEHVLMTKDTNPIEPKVLEFKLYAPDVGPALAIAVSGSSDREELVKMTKVSARAARAAGTVPLGTKYP
ncbi:MAG: hypothetical protein WD598_09110 [Acidimicrobiia bacterium]